MIFYNYYSRKMDFEETIPSTIKDLLTVFVQEENVDNFTQTTEFIKNKYSYDISQREFDDLFTRLIIASEGNEMLPTILDFYKELNPGIIPSKETYLFLLPYQKYLSEAEIERLLLQFIHRLAEKNEEKIIDPLEMLREIIKMNDPETPLFIERIFSVFPKKHWKRDMLKDIVEEANEISSHGFSTLFSIYVDISPYAPIPKWVRNFVYDPTDFPLDTEWFMACKEKSLFNEEVIEEAVKKQVPYWVVENEFEYEEQDTESIYLTVENQDTPLGFFIHDKDDKENIDEIAAFDDKENQLPYYEDLGVPDYPVTVYTPERLLRTLPEYWEDTWESIDRNITQSGSDIKIETDPEEELKFLRHRLMSLNLYALETLFSTYLGELSNEEKRTDIFYFRVYGPRNAIPVDESDEGGERMFTGITYDYDEEDDEEYEWFLHHCLICARKIRRYQHALRLPVLGGGWRGCYCSPECALKDISEEDTITPRLLEEVVDDLYAVGIQDFITEEKDDE